MNDLPHLDLTGGLDSGEFVRRLRGSDADDMRQAAHVLLTALYASVTESYEDQEPRRLTWPIFTWSAGGSKGWNFDEPIDSALCEALHVLADVVGWMPPEQRPRAPGGGVNEIDALRCLLCRGSLHPGPVVYGGVPDWPGEGYQRGQTLTAVPVIGRGPFAHCQKCRITYRVKPDRAQVSTLLSPAIVRKPSGPTTGSPESGTK